MGLFSNHRQEQLAGTRDVCFFCPCRQELSLCGKWFPARQVRLTLKNKAQPEWTVCFDCEKVNDTACLYCGCRNDEECDQCQD